VVADASAVGVEFARVSVDGDLLFGTPHADRGCGLQFPPLADGFHAQRHLFKGDVPVIRARGVTPTRGGEAHQNQRLQYLNSKALQAGFQRVVYECCSQQNQVTAPQSQLSIRSPVRAQGAEEVACARTFSSPSTSRCLSVSERVMVVMLARVDVPHPFLPRMRVNPKSLVIPRDCCRHVFHRRLELIMKRSDVEPFLQDFVWR